MSGMYERLVHLKRKGDTFSDVIERLIEARRLPHIRQREGSIWNELLCAAGMFNGGEVSI